MNTSVRYELEDLERLLALTGSTEKLIEQQMDVEIDRIKKSLVHEVFSFEDERHLERYIQYHQQEIIRMLDKIPRQVHGDRAAVAARALEDLLDFIERHFTRYFDQDAKAPDSYLSNIRKSLRINAKKIFKELNDANADQRLIEVLLQPLAKINDRNAKQEISYRKLLYAKEVQKELFKLIESNPSSDQINEELTRQLYYLNCNSTKALVYHAHLVNGIITKSETAAEKIERLSLLIKKINQAQVKPGIAYNPRASSIKEQVNNYIAEEVEYVLRVSSLNSEIVDSRDIRTTTFKIKMELSVAQLSYLIKIFLSTTLIQNSNVNELLRFFSKIIMTKKSEGVSYDSLRAKFYNVESGTKIAVREMLTVLLTHIDKDL